MIYKEFNTNEMKMKWSVKYEVTAPTLVENGVIA